jgi:hypothetical protein
VAAIADIASVTRDTVGRYFSLVSLLPSIVLTTYGFLLVSSGASSHEPHLGRAFSALVKLSLGEGIGLVLVAIVVASVLHPLQFSMVQFLEGYWGSGPVAVRVRGLSIALSRRRYMRLQKRHIDATVALLQEADRPTDSRVIRHFAMLAQRDEATRLLAELPSSDEIMPTRLGNVLRFYERAVGAPYGLDAVRAMPYMSRVAPGEDMAYINDQRSNLDLAVRTSLMLFLAAALWVCFFWWDGLWLLVALVPCTIGYLSYRGAVVAAAEYGRALAVVISLNRFTLYERLHLEQPPTGAAERRANRILNRVLAHSPANITYAHTRHDVLQPTQGEAVG